MKCVHFTNENLDKGCLTWCVILLTFHIKDLSTDLLDLNIDKFIFHIWKYGCCVFYNIGISLYFKNEFSYCIYKYLLHTFLHGIWNSLCFSSVQFSAVAQSCPTLCDLMSRSTPGLLIHHHLPEFTQTHVHQVGDAIQPSHPLSSPSPPALNPSQHQSLFQWVNSSHEVAKVLELQL